jgi:hypothetical protein
MSNPQQVAQMTLTFGDDFLQHHAGSIIADPHYALVELVANCWDAGASKVNIEWLNDGNNSISIEDNGTGMTYAEFSERWPKLNYNRLKSQGEDVQFPPKSTRRKRIAFGRNGIGRHAMFCFSDTYFVETKKDGEFSLIKVEKSSQCEPFKLTLESQGETNEHGTRIYTEAKQKASDITATQISELISSRFVADPEFNIHVNQKHISIEDIRHLCETESVSVPEYGEIKIHRFDSQKAGRTSKQNGMAWWVNRRLVGEPSWESFDEPLLDARTNTGKRFTYVIEADQLVKDIKPDWSGFYASAIVNTTRRIAYDFVRNDLRLLLSEIRSERKYNALHSNKDKIKRLPLLSQRQISDFVEEIQVVCPTMQQRDLGNAVKVLANLEEVRSGYTLLEKLSVLSSNDLEQLEKILHEWSINDAVKVLDELRYRLALIKKLDSLIENHTSDELHDLQPLFERGLWIFGPEFESISFTSNRSLSTVVKKFFGEANLEHPKKRPDFVMLPESSIGVYACDDFGKNHEISGFKSIVIIELKRGGFKITNEEKNQAAKYARELRRSGKVNKDTKIICYVLGTFIDPLDEDTATDGETSIYPRTYNTILRQAEARTFNLLRKIESVQEAEKNPDEELRRVLETDQGELFSNDINPHQSTYEEQDFSSM